MKKIISIMIAVLGILLIIIGIVWGVSLFKKNIVVTDEIKKQTVTTNTKYQQQIIKGVELALQNGHTVTPGVTKENANKFFDAKLTENSEYKNCSGEVEFTNDSKHLSYQLNTKCQKDKGTLKTNYTVTNIEEQTLENLEVKKAADGYFLMGAIKGNESVVMKFDHNNHLTFIEKVTDNAEVENNSYINVSDVYEDDDAYYILGYAQEPQGGIFVNMVYELEKIYEQNKMITKDYSFSFLLKYDKTGKLLSTKLINPVLGELIIGKVLGKKDNQLLFLSSNKLIKYNALNETIKYSELPNYTLQKSYLKGNDIYSYTTKCNFSNNHSNNDSNNDSIIKIDLSGKVIWNQVLENKETVKKNTCSEYIKNIYDLGNETALVYNHSKMISIYNNEGKQIKNLDYSNLVKSKKDILEMYQVEKKNNQLKVFYRNSKELMVDTYNEKYELENRYATGLYDATNQFEQIKEIDNIIMEETGFSTVKVLNTNNKLSVIKIDYLYE